MEGNWLCGGVVLFLYSQSQLIVQVKHDLWVRVGNFNSGGAVEFLL